MNNIHKFDHGLKKHTKTCMLYLYTLMMLAWDLDKDTHDYFRQYLNIFIYHRKTSKEIREFVNKTCPPKNCWDPPLLSEIIRSQNLLRKSLRRMYRGRKQYYGGEVVVVNRGTRITPIDKLHPSKLYIPIKGKNSIITVYVSEQVSSNTYRICEFVPW